MPRKRSRTYDQRHSWFLVAMAALAVLLEFQTATAQADKPPGASYTVPGFEFGKVALPWSNNEMTDKLKQEHPRLIHPEKVAG